ncbi:MAG: NAD(P)/FAD-dependent oxidoreductase, partial [Dehalococcoidia bacterium]
MSSGYAGPTSRADVIVIGGGPAGSTAATMLARKDLRVLLLEREHFPREHVGESLLPASMPILEELGVMPEIQKAGFLPKWGATMVWGTETEPWSWYFRETNRRYPHAYQVWRPQFDQILL